MKKIISGLSILLATNLLVSAQQVNYLNYRIASVPHTSCFSQKGDLKISILRQTYLPDIGWTTGADFGYRTKVAFTSFWENYLLVNDNQINLSYSLTDNISLNGSFLHTNRYEMFVVNGEGSNIPYKGKANAFGLGGAYHGEIATNFQWELGTSLMIGGGKFNYEESLSDELQYEKSNLSYSTFSHNLLASISFMHRKLQLTAQLNTGYVRHFGLNYTPILPYAYENIVQHFFANQTDYYIEPALIMNINLRRIGLHTHFGYPYTAGESKISKPTPTVGLGISYKIRQNRDVWIR